MKKTLGYDRFPVVRIDTTDTCSVGWNEIIACLRDKIPISQKFIVAVECYPGVPAEAIQQVFRDAFSPQILLLSEAAFFPPTEVRHQFATCLTDDPVFAHMHFWEIDDYLESGRLQQQQSLIEGSTGLVVVIGPGAVRLAPQANLLIHAGASRWELQQWQREHKVGNLGLENHFDSPSQLYKIAFFIDWRVGDRLRHEIYNRVDYFLDINHPEEPRLILGQSLRSAVAATARRPFRVVPFFDPGPWGGQWMRKHFQLPDGPANYAWCFDCVPEENSVLFDFNGTNFELPAIVLVHERPDDLLGEIIRQRFGAEFPIRFDFLDTVGGGNLSLQVHPMPNYIREHFGMSYTQDESYYILDCKEGAKVYLGLRESTVKEEMTVALFEAEAGKVPFPAAKFVNILPTNKHDHFSIPAGTVHCSGAGNIVLEISATPYIFTFKLWDWGRMGMNGLPRPIHLMHGLANVQWDRTTSWIQRELIDQVKPLSHGFGFREERTGLHTSEFLETRRHWFTEPVTHDTEGNLNVLNLVEGTAAILSSLTGAFAPMEVHYAETFIVPASVGKYTITPAARTELPMATIKAYVRG